MAQKEHYLQTPLPIPKIVHTFDSSIHLRPDMAHTHAPSASITPGAQSSLFHQADSAIHMLLIVRKSPMKTDW